MIGPAFYDLRIFNVNEGYCINTIREHSNIISLVFGASQPPPPFSHAILSKFAYDK